MIQKTENLITMGHGSGAAMTRRLISEVFNRNSTLPSLEDAVALDGNAVITTDAHVVKPIFFPGGDIGRLSVTGTVNDLAVKGSIPKYLVSAFVIEEGFPIETLSRIVDSMQAAAAEAGVRIVAGDTKVVERGKADGVYIVTTGVGYIPDGPDGRPVDLGTREIIPGDRIIVSGTMGDHAVAIANSREDLGLDPPPRSDCAPLVELTRAAVEAGGVRFMRDPTRGGLATVLNEVADETGFGLILDEEAIPVTEATASICELLGLDPLYLANEGKIVAIVHPDFEKAVLSAMRSAPWGAGAATIGVVTGPECGVTIESGRLSGLSVSERAQAGPPPFRQGVWLSTVIGGTRPLPMLESDPLPRIC